MTSCYFCKDVTHNPQKVMMWDNRRVALSCYRCRQIIVDAKSISRTNSDQLTTSSSSKLNFDLSNHDVLNSDKDRRTVRK